VLHPPGPAFLVAGGTLVAFAWIWYVLPLARRLRRSPGGDAEPRDAEREDAEAAAR
jgi:hypothetical protein